MSSRLSFAERRWVVVILAAVLISGLLACGSRSAVEAGSDGAADRPEREIPIIFVPSGPGDVRTVGTALTFEGERYVPLSLAATLARIRLYEDPGGRFVVLYERDRSTPEAPEELHCFLYRDHEDPSTLMFVVLNPGPDRVELSFATAKTYDVILTRDGEGVWKASEGRSYAQRQRQETLLPGEGLTYSIELPDLEPGRYVAHAYFEGTDLEGAAAELEIFVEGGAMSPGEAAKLLQFRLHDGLGGSYGRPQRVIFSVLNPTDEPVRYMLPTAQDFDLVVWSNERVVWRYSWGKEFRTEPRLVEIGPGGSVTHAVTLPGLEPGSYRVQAYLGRDVPVARTQLDVK